MTNILFSDASSTLQEILRLSLESRGSYTIEAVASGEEILRTLISGYKPEVVIIGSNTLGMNGLEVLRRLKSDGRFKDLDVIVYPSSKVSRFEIEKLGGIFINECLSPGNLFPVLDSITKKGG